MIYSLQRKVNDWTHKNHEKLISERRETKIFIIKSHLLIFLCRPMTTHDSFKHKLHLHSLSMSVDFVMCRHIRKFNFHWVKNLWWWRGWDVVSMFAELQKWHKFNLQRFTEMKNQIKSLYWMKIVHWWKCHEGKTLGFLDFYWIKCQKNKTILPIYNFVSLIESTIVN